ncbi:MAG: NrsF family protein [Proteobacteria bacterium]|nr:NrsF family protein [Pseudomonadota bacterium]
MDTSHLIKTLAKDARTSDKSVGTLMVWACVAASLFAATVFALLLGPRHDFAAAAETPRFLFKFVATGTLAIAACTLVPRLARPGAAPGWRAALLAIPPALLAIAVATELALVPAAEWQARWVGTNWLVCLTFIPLIGIGPLAIFIAMLRRAAPTRPSLAGAVAGLLAGGIAATFYAAHCFDDSPLFVATWYTLAVAILAAAGAAAGRLALRW